MRQRHLPSACVVAISLLIIFTASPAATGPKPPPKVCLGDSGDCRTTPEPLGSGIKWHPGNYMMTAGTGKGPTSEFAKLANEPDVRGVLQRYWWAQVEPTKGHYDFSAIEADLEMLQRVGKRLIIQIRERTYSGSPDPSGVIPDYILSDPEFHGGFAVKDIGGAGKGGVTPFLWEQPVMDRLIALNQALAKRFDTEPSFEGVWLTDETFGGFKAPPPGYSRAALAAQIKRQMTAARDAWPHTNIFVGTNGLVGEIQGIIQHAYETKCGVGGPDVLVNRRKEGDLIIQGIVGGVDYRGKTPIGYAVESGNLGHPRVCGKEDCLPSKLYDHAVNTLGATHIFWLQMDTKRDTATEKYSWNAGILPAIRAKKGITNPACPSNYRGACVN